MIRIPRIDKRLLNEVTWVLTSQVVSAIATLVALRLITEMVSPHVYGTVVLVVGVITLAQGLATGSLMQAILRFFPDLSRAGLERELRRAALRALCKPVVIALALLAVSGVGWALYQPQEIGLIALGLGLFVVEVVRSLEMAFLNAARRQREMALLMMADAWMRPFAAVAFVWMFGGSGTAVIGGYLAGCSLALAGMWLLGARQTPVSAQPANTFAFPTDIADRLWAYALPLMILPLIGWISGQADRYVVAGFASVGTAGVYAALYGLASKPFLMCPAAFEYVARPIYYARISAGDRAGERRVFAWWLAAVVSVSLVLCLPFMLFHTQLATLVLAAEYREHSALMAWIAVGYVPFCVSQVFQRVCYAYHDTRGVVLVEAVSAVLGLVFTMLLVHAFGIRGAAWAVPVRFGAQLLLAYRRARWTMRQSVDKNTPAAVRVCGGKV